MDGLGSSGGGFCFVGFFLVISGDGAEEMSDKLERIAIVSSDRCKPKKCRQECKKSCPVVRMGKCFSCVQDDALIRLLLNGRCLP